jgi:DNA-binding response OmpR family regulator
MGKRVLIVDDDTSIAEILEFNLKNEGYEVETAVSAEDALKKSLDNFHIVLLDVMMGGMSGYKMAEKMRQEEIVTPIIFITAKDTENEMLTGFSVGADDYISKPFSIKEVIARVKAVLKRSEKQSITDEKEDKLSYGNLILDFNLKELSVKGVSPSTYENIISVRVACFSTGFTLDVKSSLAYCDIKTMFPEVNRANEWYKIKNRNTIHHPSFSS